MARWFYIGVHKLINAYGERGLELWTADCNVSGNVLGGGIASDQAKAIEDAYQDANKYVVMLGAPPLELIKPEQIHVFPDEEIELLEPAEKTYPEYCYRSRFAHCLRFAGRAERAYYALLDEYNGMDFETLEAKSIRVTVDNLKDDRDDALRDLGFHVWTKLHPWVEREKDRLESISNGGVQRVVDYEAALAGAEKALKAAEKQGGEIGIGKAKDAFEDAHRRLNFAYLMLGRVIMACPDHVITPLLNEAEAGKDR